MTVHRKSPPSLIRAITDRVIYQCRFCKQYWINPSDAMRCAVEHEPSKAPISFAGFGFAIVRRCHKHGIYTLSELARCTDDEILSWEGMGTTRLATIRKVAPYQEPKQ